MVFSYPACSISFSYLTAYLFSTLTAEGQWTSSLGVQVPVMLKVNGKTYQGGAAGRTVNNVYTFSGFQDFLTDHQQEYFEVSDIRESKPVMNHHKRSLSYVKIDYVGR